MNFSYSQFSCFHYCPFRYKCRYVDHIKPDDLLSDLDPYDSRIVGRALHKAIESGSEAGIEEYKSNFYITSDQIESMCIQLDYWANKVWDVIPSGGKHEIRINYSFVYNGMEIPTVGIIDYAKDGILYDFKFTSNTDKYDSFEYQTQLNLYGALYEMEFHETVQGLKFVLIPKSLIRQKKFESITQFRARLIDTLDSMQIKVVDVPINRDQFYNFLDFASTIQDNKEWPRNFNPSCSRTCEYYDICKELED